MPLTKSDIKTLNKAEDFIRDFNELAARPASAIPDIDLAQTEMILLANGLCPTMSSLSLIARNFKDTAEEKRFIKVVNDLTEGSYKAGHPNNIKEYSTTHALHEIFPEIKISGQDPELEAKYPGDSWPPPAWDFK